MAVPWGRVGQRACAVSRSNLVLRPAGSSKAGCHFKAVAACDGNKPEEIHRSPKNAPGYAGTAGFTDHTRSARRGFFVGNGFVQARGYSGQAAELRESSDGTESTVRNGSAHYSGGSASEAAGASTRRSGLEHRDDNSSASSESDRLHEGNPPQSAQKVVREPVPVPRARPHSGGHRPEAKPPKWAHPLANVSFQSPTPDAFSVRAFLETQHRVDWKTGSYVVQLAPSNERGQRNERPGKGVGSGGAESRAVREWGSEPLDRRKGGPVGELEWGERKGGPAEELGRGERADGGAEVLEQSTRKGAQEKELEWGERRRRSVEELDRGGQRVSPVEDLERGERKKGRDEELERGGRIGVQAEESKRVGGPRGGSLDKLDRGWWRSERGRGAVQGDQAESGVRFKGQMHRRQGDRKADAESTIVGVAGAVPSVEKARVASQTEPDDDGLEEHPPDALAQAEAEALLESLRGLPSAAEAGEELRARAGQGLLDWSHVDKLCRTLLASEDPRDEELLFAGLSVACGMEMSVRETVKKWALMSFMIRRLVKSGRIAAAKRVPSCWSDSQATSRALARKVLTSSLVKSGALSDAVEVFEASLAAGLLVRELLPVGKQLVSKLIHTKQFPPAMQLTLALGKAGEYAPFVEVIGALSDEQMFLEAFYILDVYSKAVDKPDTKLLVKVATQYAEHGYEQTGLEFLAVLRKADSAPHPELFKVLARAYTIAKLPALVQKVNEARGECVRESDARFPVALVNAYLDAGDVSKAGGLCAAAIAKKLTARDRELNQTLHRLLSAHAAAGNVPEGWEVLRWLDARGAFYHIDLLTPLFEAVLRESGGDVTRLMDAFEAHRRHLAGRKAATWLHKSLFQFLTSKALLEDAVAVFEAGVQDGVSVPLTNTIRLIFDLIEAGHPTVALGVLRRAPEMEREYPKLFYKLTDRLGEGTKFLPFE